MANYRVRNLSVSEVVLSDVGITIAASGERDLHDRPNHAVARSAQLVSQISAGNLVLLDNDGTTPLSMADSLAALDQKFNTRMLLNDVSDVDTTGIINGQALLYNSGVFNPGNISIGVDRIQEYYVNKHGNDSNTGLRPDVPFLTFGAAITAATAQTPSTTNRFSITCDDAGIYSESFTVPSWVQIVATGAKIEGTVTLDDDAEVHVFEIEAAVNTSAIVKSTGSGTSRAIAEIARTTGTGDTIANGASVTGVLIVNVRQIFVENGTGVIDNSTGAPGHVHVEVEDLYITGTGSGVDSNTVNGLVVGRAAHILEIGGGVGFGTAFTVSTGRVDMTCGFIDATTAYNVSGAGRLRILVNELGGTRTQTVGSAVVDILEANALRWITIDDTDSPYSPRRIEFLNIDTTNGPVEVDLDSAASDGDVVWFQDAARTFGTNNLTIDANGNTISGSPTITIDVNNQSGFAVFRAAASDWSVTFTSEAAFSPDNVIYVTKNGNDTTGDGSFSNPFLTIKKGVTEALSRVSVTPVPTTVKVLDGIYDEVNPINITGTASEMVQVQGEQEQAVFARPTVDTSPLFSLTSNVTTDGPVLSRMTINAGSLATFKTNNQAAVVVTGPGRFFVDKVNVINCGIGIDSGNGVSTDQESVYAFATISGCNTGIDAKGDGLQTVQVSFIRNNTTGLDASGNVRVEMGNYSFQGADFGDSAQGTGVSASDSTNIVAVSGTITNHVVGAEAGGTSLISLSTTIFRNNTADFDQQVSTAEVAIQGALSKTKQLIADGANVSLNYIDTDTGDYIVGNADATGDTGKEFRVRSDDGRVAIGDNATDANIASGGVGGSRSVNLIDENGNFRAWRFVSVAGQDPAFEWIKGINAANPDGVGDAPITQISAASVITVDVSGTDYNDPFDATPGIDRTTLAGRAFPTGRLIRVNGTGQNGDYTVSSTAAVYNSGPQTIDITVDEATALETPGAGVLVFGGGAGRPDGVSTVIGDPGAAVAAGTGNVWWDMFLQETDSYVVRRRTGGGGSLIDEKVRLFSDRSEWLGASLYDNSDNAFIAVMQNVASAVNYLTINNSITTAGPEIVATGSDTNIDIEMIPKGTGTVTVPTGYEANITADEDLVNKAYVDSVAGAVTVSTINGQPVPTFVDSTRTKTLSVSDSTIIYAEASLSDLDWFAIGDASNSLTGYIAPLQGTIVYAFYHCEEDNGAAKELDLYINGVLNTTLFTLPGATGESSATLTTLSIDFAQGDKIQMRAGTTGGTVNDTLVTMWIKWRV